MGQVLSFPVSNKQGSKKQANRSSNQQLRKTGECKIYLFEGIFVEYHDETNHIQTLQTKENQASQPYRNAIDVA